MKKIISFLLIAVLMVGAVILVKIRKKELANEKPPSILPVVVDTIKLRKEKVSLTLPAMGIIGSELSSTLSTKISGRVVAVYKQEGDRIEKGEHLAKIDASDLIAKKNGLILKQQGINYQIDAVKGNIKALKTALESANETHMRTKDLYAVKGASIEQLRQEEANIAKISAELAAAKNQISTLKKNQESINQNIKEIESLIAYSDIVSPVSGTLSGKMVMPGDMAMPGKPLFRIASGQGLYINLFLPYGIKPEGVIFHGRKLDVISKNQASGTGLIQYIAQVPNSTKVIEGQYVNVRVITFSDTATLIPMDGILRAGGKVFIFESKKDKTVQKEIKIRAKGSEGIVPKRNLDGKIIIIAKPDILLRVSAGVPVLKAKNNISPAKKG